MQLSVLDWAMVVFYLLASLGISLWYSKRASSSLSEYFVGGRQMPWWLAGVSLVATTFAADTPLAVTEIVMDKGISGNWLWWNMLIGGLLTTFFFARLWRRAETLTDLELLNIRYSGKLVPIVRVIKAFQIGFFMNAMIIGWVNQAMMTILQAYFQISAAESLLWIGVCLLLTASYSALSGIWGVAVTDAFQFILAMTGCIVLALFTLSSDTIGGISGLLSKIPTESLQFFPQQHSMGKQFLITPMELVAFIGIQWWASWYPGAEPGGGGYVVQRMQTTRNESEAVRATLLFQVLHYALRPWPWIVVGLCGIILYPNLSAEESKFAYLFAIRDFLPAGLRGLMFVAFLAAYMSTIATQLNWGTSYLINDAFRPIIKPNQPESYYVKASRIFTMVLMFVSLWVTTQLDSVKEAWSFVLECGAGVGFVLILRWFWQKISIWSELVATITPFVVFASLKMIGKIYPDYQLNFPYSYFLTVGLTVLLTVIVTLVAPPTDSTVLEAFYAKVRPGGWWQQDWKRNYPSNDLSFGLRLLAWLIAMIASYSFLFAVGSFLLEQP
ncbi:MAG: Na+:solute symporter, partial [Bacteroidia bacterium]|nr:Na+:solute symporter [Bacteroidia bacterium]